MRRNPRRVTVTLVSALAVIALAACGDDGGVSADDSSSTDTEQTDTTSPTTEAPDTGEAETTAATTPETDAPTTEAPTTAEAPETTAPPETTTGGEDGDTACGTLAPLIASATVYSTIPVDWNGDGTQDATASVYETDSGNGDYRLRVEETPGFGSEVAIISDGVSQPQVIGTVQVDFSLGSDQPQPEELLVVVGANASGYNLGVYFNDGAGCLERFKAADESDLVLPIHASIGTASGLACDGGAGSQFIVRTEATASAGSGEYDVHDIKLRREGNQLVDDVDIPGFIVDDGSPTSPFARYSSIYNCNVDFGGE